MITDIWKNEYIIFDTFSARINSDIKDDLKM